MWRVMVAEMIHRIVAATVTRMLRVMAMVIVIVMVAVIVMANQTVAKLMATLMVR